MLCTQFRADACFPVSTYFLFHTSTIPNTEVVGRLCLRQRNKCKCQEHCEDDVSHPIDNLDNSFSFFFIHTSVPMRNMVMPSVDAAKVQTGYYRRIARVIKNYCNLTMS